MTCKIQLTVTDKPKGLRCSLPIRCVLINSLIRPIIEKGQVRKEMNEGKGQETESRLHAFRNAHIPD